MFLLMVAFLGGLRILSSSVPFRSLAAYLDSTCGEVNLERTAIELSTTRSFSVELEYSRRAVDIGASCLASRLIYF